MSKTKKNMVPVVAFIIGALVGSFITYTALMYQGDLSTSSLRNFRSAPSTQIQVQPNTRDQLKTPQIQSKDLQDAQSFGTPIGNLNEFGTPIGN